MRKLLWIALSLLGLSGAAGAAEPEHWLHVRVQDGADKIAVNLPIELVSAILDAADSDHYRHGALVIEDREFDHALVAAMLDAAVRSRDGEFVRIEEGDGGRVRVHKEKDMLLVHIDDESEQVRVSLPIAVARAMLEAEGEALNVKAALEEMAKRGGALVTIDDGESTVRVWVDGSMEGI